MILVTGASGFLGNHVARALRARGEPVRVLVRASSPRDLLADMDGVEPVVGDLCDRASLEKAVAGCEQVYHVAADYRFDVPDPEAMYRANVQGSRDLLEAAGAAGAKRIVYTSTVGCIGLPDDGTPGSETTPVSLEKMIGTYKRTKFQAELAVLELAKQGLPVVVVNPTAPIGERDLKPTPTGATILRFLQRKMPAYVDTGLNLIDARDCAEGHLLAAERGKPGERYILGCRNMTLREICEALAKITGLPAPKIRLPYFVAYMACWFDTKISGLRGRTPEMSLEGIRMAKKKMFVDASKAVKELGLKQTPPEEPLARAVEWFREKKYV